MRVCVVGTGYVGLVTGAGFAEMGNQVVCLDLDQAKIDALRRNEIPIFEPGLDDLVARNVEAGRLSFALPSDEEIAAAQLVFICVGTPTRKDGGADLTQVDTVAAWVAKAVGRELILVLKSTVPVGTNERIRRIVEGSAHPIHVVSNPEFLKQGDAVADFLRPDRIVVGCDEEDTFAVDLMARLYHPLCLDRNRIIWMDPPSAELTKYVANTMLAMRISFMNEVAAMCDVVGADIHRVREAVGSDSRIGTKFLYAGPGYGGSCFPKDVSALVHTGRQHGLEIELAAATDRVNSRQRSLIYRKLRAMLGGDVRGKRVAIWGCTFKPRTDDLRESAAITLIDALISDGALVAAHDPEARDAVRAHFGDKVNVVEDAYTAVQAADALVLMTEWREYQNPDFDRVRGLMHTPILFDCRNIWSGYGLRGQGFVYAGIGTKGS